MPVLFAPRAPVVAWFVGPFTRTAAKMLQLTRRIRPPLLAALLVAAIALAPATAVYGADLQPKTVAAYQRYVRATEARIARDKHLPQRFLYIENLPAAKQQEVWQTLKQGEIWLESLDTRDEAGRELDAPDGLITHWLGDVFIPHATIEQVQAVIEDFDHLSEIYAPEIVRSRMIVRDDGSFRTYFRLHKDTPWVNPTLDVESKVTSSAPDARHASTHSASIRILQIENAGKPDEHADTEGHDSGYLWRLNTYWRFEERDGGVVAEWEAITLSRDIPFLLRWFVRPYIEHLARSTVRDTLVATRKEVEKRLRAAHPPK